MSDRPEPITVWAFYDAPPELAALSGNGGDEDWLAEVPPNHHTYGNPPEIPLDDGGYRLPAWMSGHGFGASFGCSGTDVYLHPSRPGWVVAIGCHA